MDYVPLDVDKIAASVRSLGLRPELRYIPATGSTNRLARELGAADWRHGTVVITDFQSAGRGRMGRAWEAPAGTSLLLSIILELPEGASTAEALMVASLAVADAVEDVTELRPSLKWPNDILLSGKKVCGVLAEYAEQDGRRRLIVGIGLNVNFNPELAGIADASSLSAEAGRTISREQTAIALFNRLDMWYLSFTEEPDKLFDNWAQRLVTIGSPVVVIESDLTWYGQAVGVLRNGGLQVRTPGGEVRAVYAADVSVRKREGFTTS
jgi:BirA family biotin operon repressor/biotin-[acetyl-CoA-carboxylase] ligase